MRGFFTGAALKLLIAAGFAVILINDLGSVVSSHYLLSERAEQIASASLSTYEMTGSKRRAYDEAIANAGKIGATLMKFDIEPRSVGVGIEIPPHRTWVLHRIESLRPYLAAKAEYTATK